MAVPLGPMGILCIKRTLSHGRLSGFVTGLGTATIDALYSSVAAFSLTLISVFILNHAQALQALGILVLFYMGITVIREKSPSFSLNSLLSRNIFKDYTSSLVLTLCNPITILSFMGALAALDISGSMGTGSSIALVTGVFLGSTLWWGILSGVMGSVRYTFTEEKIRQVNRVSGSIIIIFALALLVRVVYLLKA